MVILVVGGHGQLGQALQSIEKEFPEVTFIFTDSDTLNILKPQEINAAFEQFKPDYCINASAYTAVDKAESEPELAQAINVEGVENLATACKTYQTVLFHISTDFVFDGSKKTPYTEQDIPNPKGVYGQTKLDGEKVIQTCIEQYYIIRTSWLYSQFANNFMKTMLRLATERDTLSIVNDQIGTPTQAVDLAEVIMVIINYHKNHQYQPNYGLYHFSNEGQCSWFEFAQGIFKKNNIKIHLNPIPTSAYPTPAQRPFYSVLDKSKIKNTFGIHIKKWEESLQPFPN